MSEPPAKDDMGVDDDDDLFGLMPRSAVSDARASIGLVDFLGDALACGVGDGLPKLAKPNGSDDGTIGVGACAAYGGGCICVADACCGGGANAKSPINGCCCCCCGGAAGATGGGATLNAVANGSTAACGCAIDAGADAMPPANISKPAHGDAAAAGAGALTAGAGAARPPSKSSMLDVAAGGAAFIPGTAAATGAPDA